MSDPSASRARPENILIFIKFGGALAGTYLPITSGKLRTLREHIRQTDKLIDALVYELYGLTEEEIGIVEVREVEK